MIAPLSARGHSISISHPLSSTFIHFHRVHPCSSMFIPVHPLSSTFIHFHQISSNFIHFHLLHPCHPLSSILSTFIHFQPFLPLSSTFIHLIHFHPLWVWWVSGGPLVDSGCHVLSENVWFVWSKTFHNGLKLRCHACERRTHTQLWQYSSDAGLTETLRIIIVPKHTAKNLLKSGDPCSQQCTNH